MTEIVRSSEEPKPRSEAPVSSELNPQTPQGREKILESAKTKIKEINDKNGRAGIDELNLSKELTRMVKEYEAIKATDGFKEEDYEAQAQALFNTLKLNLSTPAKPETRQIDKDTTLTRSGDAITIDIDGKSMTMSYADGEMVIKVGEQGKVVLKKDNLAEQKSDLYSAVQVITYMMDKDKSYSADRTELDGNLGTKNALADFKTAYENDNTTNKSVSASPAQCGFIFKHLTEYYQQLNANFKLNIPRKF